MSINKQKANAIGLACEAALKGVAEEFGLSVEYRGGRYDPALGTYKPKIEFKEDGADKREFGLYATRYGLVPGDFGEQFESGGRVFEIAGVSPRSPKRPILCTEVATGKTYKFTPRGVAQGLGK